MIKRFCLKLKHQIILLIGIPIIILLVIQIVLYFSFLGTMKDKTKIYARNTIMQVEEKISTICYDMKKTANLVGYSNTTQQYLVEKEPIKRLELYQRINENLSYLQVSIKDISSIIILDQERRLVDTALNTDYELLNTFIDSYKVYDSDFIRPVFTKLEYSILQNKYFYAYIMPVFSTKELGTVKNIGTVLIVSSAEPIQNIASRVEMSDSSHFLIADGDNNLIGDNNAFAKLYEKDDQNQIKISDNIKNDYIKNSKFIYQDIIVPEINWKIICIIDAMELTEELKTVYFVMILLTVMILLALSVIAGVLIRSISTPIVKIANFMKKVPQNGLEERLKITAYNELGIIVENFNIMMDKIYEYNYNVIETQAKLYEVELEKKHAQLSALQSQINPHFLYNTLDCIKGIALNNDVFPIVNICVSMAKIFRYCIKSEEFVTLKEEIECIEYYNNIILIRYREKIKIDVRIEKILYEEKCIKMILQPLIENAVYHGVELKVGSGNITISGSIVNDKIVLIIADNGKGINEEDLELIQNALINGYYENKQEVVNHHGNIGLININNRIKFMFGNEYGLDIQSIKEYGTTVTIKLPLIDKP